MPFIHIKSLPFNPPLKVSAVIAAFTKDFAKGTGIGIEHVTATWEFLLPGHYAVAGKVATTQPPTSHPLLVDLLSPDFNSPAQIEKMLRVTASSLAKRARVPIENIFIHHHPARSGMVFDAGTIERW